MTQLNQTQALILVFAMPGCEACADYMPRFEKRVKVWQDHGHPFVYHANGKTYSRKQIPIAVFDSTSQDQGLQDLCNSYGIENLPTTILLTYNAPMVKLEGAVEDKEIHELLQAAALANR